MNKFFRWFDSLNDPYKGRVESLNECIEEINNKAIEASRAKRDALIKEWPLGSKVDRFGLTLYITGHTSLGVEFEYVTNGVIYRIEYRQDQLVDFEK